MSARALLIFRDDDRLGNSPAHGLFDLVTVERTGEDRPARDFHDDAVKLGADPIDDIVPVGGQKAWGNGVALLRRI